MMLNGLFALSLSLSASTACAVSELRWGTNAGFKCEGRQRYQQTELGAVHTDFGLGVLSMVLNIIQDVKFHTHCGICSYVQYCKPCVQNPVVRLLAPIVCKELLTKVSASGTIRLGVLRKLLNRTSFVEM
uniref:Putative secreted protein n=1 Tax=Amblyomma triste TaxID=251400 RepID=A0A023G207_AMBTT